MCPTAESNYMLFGAIMDYYDEHKPDGEIMRFKELVAKILGCDVKDAIPEMNALLQAHPAPAPPAGLRLHRGRLQGLSPCPWRPTSSA